MPSSYPSVAVIGGGVAGLCAALAAQDGGAAVTLYEAAPMLGGRARAYDDPQLGRTLEPGPHMLLGGCRAAMALLKRLRARDRWAIAPRPVIPMIDLAQGTSWEQRLDWPGLGALPGLWRLLRARPGDAAAAVLGGDAWGERYWRPLTEAILTTPYAEAEARALIPTLRTLALAGPGGLRPMWPKRHLGDALIEPLAEALTSGGARIELGARVDDLAALPADRVILAVPPWAAARLAPGCVGPRDWRALACLHVVLETPPPGPDGFTALLGGAAAEWLFRRGDQLSLFTLRRAPDPLDLWADARRALPGLPAALPARSRLVTEKRAAMAMTPGTAARRPAQDALGERLLLAGDWVQLRRGGPYPSTIEGAVRSGLDAGRRSLKPCV